MSDIYKKLPNDLKYIINDFLKYKNPFFKKEEIYTLIFEKIIFFGCGFFTNKKCTVHCVCKKCFDARNYTNYNFENIAKSNFDDLLLNWSDCCYKEYLENRYKIDLKYLLKNIKTIEKKTIQFYFS